MRLDYKYKTTLAVLLSGMLIISCKKLVDIEAPVTSTNAANVYVDDATAAAVLTGIYINISQSTFNDGGLTSMSLFPGLSADEFTLFSGVTTVRYLAYYKNALTSSNLASNGFWSTLYPIIFVVNSAIEGLESSTSLTPTVKQQLLGEAKFLRAFCYFYLTNLYGDVPLAITTDFRVNSLLARTAQEQVYKQIITDLKDAQELLNENYVQSDAKTVYSVTSAERVRPNKAAATALLARVYLYVKDYANSEAESSKVINSPLYKLVTQLTDVFLKNSAEAIWQIQPVTINPSNTWDGRLFILPTAGPNSSSNPVYLSNTLLNVFESNDLRKNDWTKSVNVGNIEYNYPYKYKISSSNAPVSEYTMVLRLSELYLIRAEARAQQNNTSGSVSDLNIIRDRAGLPMISFSDKSSLLTAILNERQVELFSEWGHRWLDLKRTGNIDAVMNVVVQHKGTEWNSNLQLYPIPLNELKSDPNLTQNDGY